MFSLTTTASSITMPMAIAMAPSVMRLNVCHTSHIAHTEAVTNHHVADVFRRRGFLRGDDEVLLVVLRNATHRLNRGSSADSAGQVVVGKALLGESHRIGNDFDLPHVRRLHV